MTIKNRRLQTQSDKSGTGEKNADAKVMMGCRCVSALSGQSRAKRRIFPANFGPEGESGLAESALRARLIDHSVIITLCDNFDN
jgi:hypothetical protein